MAPSATLLERPQPSGVQAVEKTAKTLAGKVDLLRQEMQQRTGTADKQIVDYEAVELMSMNREVAKAGKIPAVFLVDFPPTRCDIRVLNPWS
jgi:hypothetical protein